MRSADLPDAQESSCIRVSRTQDVTPLDDQFGVDAPKTVPDALHDVLFGQSQPSGEDTANTGESLEADLVLRTYAILDAAKITNFPELIETSGLEHRCLFKGKAYDELKSVAPWVVRLEDGNSFTRNLFTRSESPWHVWDNEAGIYVRSHGTLDEMWEHFRKFTRVQDENEQWFYFRFWEPKLVIQMFSAFGDEEAQRFLGPCASLFAMTSKPKDVCTSVSLNTSYLRG